METSTPALNPRLRLFGERDQLFAADLYPNPFEFNESVARVFDDMARRSIPLYEDVTRSVVDWSVSYYQTETYVYDVGCSTGTTLEAIARASRTPARLVGIDKAPAMLERAEAKLKPWLGEHEIQLRCEDVLQSHFAHASVVIINYTLQFLPLAHRLELLSRIHQAMVPGGILYLSDKVRSSTDAMQRTVTHAYERFKEEQGYSRTEIERKKEALDDVLVPLAYHEQMDLVAAAGFRFVEPVMKWNNFCSFVAQK